jgi:hypothetical protein
VFTGKQQITTRSKRTNHHNTLAVSEFAQCECHGYTIMKMAYYFQLLFWLRETRFRCKINLKYLIKNSTEQEYHVTVSLLTGIVITLDSVVYFDPFASDKELLLHSQTCVRRSPFWGKWSFKAGYLVKEVQFIWNFLWQEKKRPTFWYRWLLNRVDRMAGLNVVHYKIPLYVF